MKGFIFSVIWIIVIVCGYFILRELLSPDARTALVEIGWTEFEAFTFARRLCFIHRLAVEHLDLAHIQL